MSRVAKRPIHIPSGVEVSVDGQAVTVKGPKGTLVHQVHETDNLQREDNVLNFEPREISPRGWAFAGTTRALINNMVAGVSTGFERKLELVGVGYRAQAQGKTLNLTLGYSHPINFEIPEGITIETPSQTEVVVRGTDKQQVGQVAAKIRGFRAPEPYKGKGVKYSDEVIVRKEAKKK
ncbi:MAG: 50S ribosomal protein L6 [Gammaproteobacteria bacterium]